MFENSELFLQTKVEHSRLQAEACLTIAVNIIKTVLGYLIQKSGAGKNRLGICYFTLFKPSYFTLFRIYFKKSSQTFYNMIDHNITAKAEAWLNSNIDELSKQEIRALLAAESPTDLIDALDRK